MFTQILAYLKLLTFLKSVYEFVQNIQDYIRIFTNLKHIYDFEECSQLCPKV